MGERKNIPYIFIVGHERDVKIGKFERLVLCSEKYMMLFFLVKRMRHNLITHAMYVYLWKNYVALVTLCRITHAHSILMT